MSLQDQLVALSDAFYQRLSEAQNAETFESLRIDFFGKKGRLKTIMKTLGDIPKSEMPKIGQQINVVRDELTKAFDQAFGSFKENLEKARLKAEKIDVTIPGKIPATGVYHPITQTIRLISDVFIGMGYQIAEGPEIEAISYNFDRLNIPSGHPSRDERDTYYLNDVHCLRTQTSPVQIRVLEEQAPPIRIICPGKVYRPDTPDATHSPVFHQIEGLVVDRGVAMSDLVGTLNVFAKALFGPQTHIRLRPHHFPFTEPSCEVDVTCWKCGGKGCPTCKHEGYVEVLGAGMVHPNVLKNSGVDPEIYSGFAFGIGVERTAMARFNIDDIRHFYDNDLRFLMQFK